MQKQGKVNGVIYVWENKINGKKYVGQTIKVLQKRINEHLFNARLDKPTMYISKAIKKYGEDNFRCYQIDKARTKNALNKKETYWIKMFCSDEPEYGYNLTIGGDSAKVTDLAKKHMSKAQKGRIITSEHARKIGLTRIGKPLSEETKNKIKEVWATKSEKEMDEFKSRVSETMKKHVRTEEHKRNISLSKMGKNNPMYGKHHSEESNEKRRQKVTGYHHTEEAKRKISEKLKGNQNGRKRASS
jgi:hypothetical protein